MSQTDTTLGPVVRSLVSANRWLRGIKTYKFPWYLTLVSANHASSNPGLVGKGSYADNRQSKTLETWMPLSDEEIHKQIGS